jgi:DNA-binding MarR family transcriptional regulator
MVYENTIEAAAALRRGATRLVRRMRSDRRDSPVSNRQLGILADLHRIGPCTPGELSDRAGIQPQSLTRPLAALEDLGLISRRIHPGDARASLMTITAAGIDVLRHDAERREAWLGAALASELTPTEREILRLAGDLMVRVASAP